MALNSGPRQSTLRPARSVIPGVLTKCFTLDGLIAHDQAQLGTVANQRFFR